MKQADIVVDPAEIELDDQQPRLHGVRGRRHHDPQERRDPATSSRRSPSRASRKQIILRFLRSPVELQGDGKLEKVDRSAATSWSRRGRLAARQGHRRARGARVRAAAALGRLHRRRRSRASPFDEKRGTILNADGRVLERRGRRPPSRPLHVGLDQARPQRRDRHQQEVRPGDRRRTCSRTSRPAGCTSPRPRIPTRSRSCFASAESTSSATPAGRRSTPPRSARGEPQGRPRVKFVRVEEMLEAARDSRVAELVADLAELEAMIEAALPGAEVEVVDETAAATTCARRARDPVRGPQPPRPAPARQGGGAGALRRRLDPRAFGQDVGARRRA